MRRARGEPAERLSPGLLGALGFVAMAGALSTDLYLPSFPNLRADFGATASAVQLTLTAFLLGAGIGQFSAGTVSDALGRRRTLVVALAAFAAIGFAASAAPTLEWLVSLRFLQGIAGASGAALARAVVADLSQGEATTRGLGLILAMTGLGPVIGSPLGALLSEWGGWRAALLGLAVVAVAMLAAALAVIPESLPLDRRHAPRIGALLRNVASLARDSGFLGYALAYALAYAALMVYIAASSFVVQGVLGASAFVYALTFSAGAAAFAAGAWQSGRIAQRVGARAALRIGHALSLAAALALVVLEVAGALSLVTWVPIICVFAAGCAIGMTGASALALRRGALMTGAASAGLGLLQYTLGAIASPVGGAGGGASALPALAAMAVAVALAAVCAVSGARAGDPRASREG